jgi:hypothetical protein
MLLTLTSKQKRAIEDGRSKRKRLVRVTKKASNKSIESTNSSDEFSLVQKKRHYYIYGPSGVGKTYNMEKAVKETGVKHYVISGNVSMWAFAVQLACIKGSLKNDEKVVVIVDDCDELLKDGKSANQLKELLDKNQFSYNKKPQLHTLTSDYQLACVEQCMSDDNMGFKVDCSNFTFVITSNIKLPFDSTPEEMLEKNGGNLTPRIAYMKHLTAIRGRMNVKDLSFTKEEKWGNIAIVLLEDNGCPQLTEQQKIFLLQWMDSNWDDMTETSIRTAEKMADILIEEGEESVVDAWECDFLK